MRGSSSAGAAGKTELSEASVTACDLSKARVKRASTAGTCPVMPGVLLVLGFEPCSSPLGHTRCWVRVRVRVRVRARARVRVRVRVRVGVRVGVRVRFRVRVRVG